MITVTQRRHFDDPTQLADWLAEQTQSGTLIASINGRDFILTYGDPPGGATFGQVGYVNPRTATLAWLRKITEAADASAPPYENLTC